MELKLYLSNPSIQQMLADLVQGFLFSLAEQVGVDINQIATIGIAEDTQYGAAVKELFPDGRYTNNGGYLGVGKTETTITPAGQPMHTILFDISVFGRCASGSESKKSLEDWSAEEQFGPYIISHELGHCRFNDEYRSLQESLDFEAEGIDDFTFMNNHHFQVLVGEIGACSFGHPYLSKELLDHAWGLDKEVLKDHCTKLQQSKAQNDVEGVAYGSYGLAWLYIIQISKSFFGVFKTDLQESPINPPSSLGALSSVHDDLFSAFANFNNLDFQGLEVFRQQIYAAHVHILELLRVKIDKLDDGFCCYWK